MSHWTKNTILWKVLFLPLFIITLRDWFYCDLNTKLYDAAWIFTPSICMEWHHLFDVLPFKSRAIIQSAHSFFLQLPYSNFWFNQFIQIIILTSNKQPNTSCRQDLEQLLYNPDDTCLFPPYDYNPNSKKVQMLCKT